MFRSFINGGQTFDNKINLRNTTNAESVDANIAGSENNVYVRQCERNATVNEPVMEVSNDIYQTFGQMILISAK